MPESANSLRQKKSRSLEFIVLEIHRFSRTLKLSMMQNNKIFLLSGTATYHKILQLEIRGILSHVVFPRFAEAPGVESNADSLKFRNSPELQACKGSSCSTNHSAL